jgi:hypothetical protein
MDTDRYFVERQRRDDEADRMMRANKPVMAARQGWPDGALEMCVRLTDDHPGWDVTWLGENTVQGFERPAVYTAYRRRPAARLYGADPCDLSEQIRLAGEAEQS